MLKSFTLQNAFSFADKHELDMQATKIKAHNYSLLTSYNNKNIPAGIDILPVMSIYGANASGKTNLVRALLFVLQSIVYDEKNINHHVLPYMLNTFISEDDQVNFPSFDLTFLLNRNEYTLTIHSLVGVFHYEELSWREAAKGKIKRIYRRTWNEKTKRWSLTVGSTIFDKCLIDEIKYVNSMEKNNKNLLLYALCKRNQHNLFDAILRWVSCFDTAKYYINNSVNAGLIYTGDENPYLEYYNESKSKGRILNFLQTMNPHIKDYQFIELDNPPSTTHKYELCFEYNRRRKTDSTTKNVDKVLSSHESKGLYSAFTLLPAILKALENGGVLVFDELENSLHPLLMSKVVGMFTDPDVNIGGGQLIFTTHNALIMDRKYLRQDEIGFVEKDDNGRSEFYRLSDIDGVRSDLDFCKKYILGAFGAVPKL